MTNGDRFRWEQNLQTAVGGCGVGWGQRGASDATGLGRRMQVDKGSAASRGLQQPCVPVPGVVIAVHTDFPSPPHYLGFPTLHVHWNHLESLKKKKRTWAKLN